MCLYLLNYKVQPQLSVELGSTEIADNHLNNGQMLPKPYTENMTKKPNLH